MILAASGVPNDRGKVTWPLGLRLLDSEEAAALRQQAEALFQVAAMQARLGQINSRLTQELVQAVNELQGQFRVKNNRSPLPRGVSDEAERFLNRLKKAPELLEQALATPQGDSGQPQTTAPSTQAPATVQVGMYDDYFELPTVTVAAGTVVLWVNHGWHGHTVTSNDGVWDSGKIEPGAVYGHVFARPGTYPYHCTSHPQKMQGVVVVK